MPQPVRHRSRRPPRSSADSARPASQAVSAHAKTTSGRVRCLKRVGRSHRPGGRGTRRFALLAFRSARARPTSRHAPPAHAWSSSPPANMARSAGLRRGTAGLSDAGIRRRIGAGLLEPIGGHVLRFAGHPESWRTLLSVGLLDLGPSAVVAEPGRRRPPRARRLPGEDRSSFLAPRPAAGTSARSAPYTRWPACPGSTKVEVGGFPATSAARTIVDLSRVLHRA